MSEAGRARAVKPLDDEEDERQDLEIGVGVEGSVGEGEQD